MKQKTAYWLIIFACTIGATVCLALLMGMSFNPLDLEEIRNAL